MAISGRTKYQISVHICIKTASSCNTENIDKLNTERHVLPFIIIWKDLIHQISVLIYLSIKLVLVGKELFTTNCLK